MFGQILVYNQDEAQVTLSLIIAGAKSGSVSGLIPSSVWVSMVCVHIQWFLREVLKGNLTDRFSLFFLDELC